MNNYRQQLLRVIFPWGLLVCIGKFMVGLLTHANAFAKNSLIGGAIEAVAFGLLFSVAMAYIAYRRQA
jgi:nitrate reductase gamma subunit